MKEKKIKQSTFLFKIIDYRQRFIHFKYRRYNKTIKSLVFLTNVETKFVEKII